MPKENNMQQAQQAIGASGDVSSPEYETVDLREYIGILFRRRWLMLATLLAVLIGGMAYTLHRKPVFESTAQILVVTNSAGSSAAGSIPFLSDLQALTKSRSIDTQVEVIESADLIALAFHAEKQKRIQFHKK